MTSGQLSSQIARRTRPGVIRRSWLGRFAINRARETGYGAFFATVFLLCQSPASSLAIDDIRILSKLGEPLMAEVVVSPTAGEILRRGCFRTIASSGDLPGVGAVRLTLSRSLNTSVLSIAGSRPMREPLSEFVLQVKCPGVPTMVKSFLVMVDPPVANATVTAPATVASPLVAASRQPRTRQQGPTGTRSPRPAAIPPGSQYMVRSGDTLSTIAARVSGRPDWSVWPIAQHIYATNPGAFLLGNPNVIAEAAVISIPRLADVDMSLSAANVRPVVATRPVPVAATVAPVPVPAAAPVPVAAPSAPAVAPAANRTVAGSARIMPTPTAVVAPATPLPAMQLTRRLLSESQVKILLRAHGSPVAPTVVITDPAPAVPAGTTPDPQSEPERPDSVATGTRAVLQPGQPAQADARTNWLWIIVGLLTGLLIGAFAAVSLFRRNLRQEYEHDVREAVQRQVHTDRLRQQREQPVAGAAPVAAATMDLAPAGETDPVADNTVEMSTVEGVDFELSSQDEPATVGAPETLEMPGVATDLDLELPVETGKTGQHEVDFDLLEAAYSEDYQAEFVKTAETEDNTTDDDTTETGDDSDRYYHLENRDPTDDSPLPLELGEDEMGSDDDTEDDGKIVRFRR